MATVSVTYLVVAGGGAGKTDNGGGGGAGGLLTGTTSITNGNTYTITVGAGGTAATRYLHQSRQQAVEAVAIKLAAAAVVLEAIQVQVV